jgi:UDP-N-acetylglucosamine 1-carboxyvinyltransferase
MDRFIIQGGVPLRGEVRIGGAKNAALPLLAATLLSEAPCRLSGVPLVRDVVTLQRLLRQIGAVISGDTIEVKQIECCEAPYDLVKTMRAAILVLGPLLARCGEAHVSLPGGCAIGARPVDIHLSALRQMGAEIQIEHGMIHAKTTRLRGADIHFERTTVTGTENLMMAAVLAEGTTVLSNAAPEPEVADLAHFLSQCGAKIQGAGSDQIVIEGVRALHGTSYRVIPDRIEAATLMIAGALTGGDLWIRACNPAHLKAVIRLLQTGGVSITTGNDFIHVEGSARMKAVDIATESYPNFPTDMQPQLMALLSCADGCSRIVETVFENRFHHVPELLRMGADIHIEGNCATISGVSRLSGACVMASDLRAGAALVLAGLAADGETEVSRVYHIDRGYEHLEAKLIGVGARIQRVATP